MGGMELMCDGNVDVVDSKEIVRRLSIGPKAIDRMRKEIDSVVNMVVGMVPPRDIIEWGMRNNVRFGRATTTFSSPECEWRIFVNQKGSLGVECRLLYQTCHPADFAVCVYSTTFAKGVKDIQLRHVKNVRECLSVFEEGMAKTFPFLPESWQPLLDAADYAEKNGW